MPVYDKYNFLLLPKMLVLNPKDGNVTIMKSIYQTQEKLHRKDVKRLSDIR